MHGPMDYAKKLKPPFRVGDLDLPERRKIYTSSQEEEDVDAHVCQCGTTIESRTRTVGEYGIYIQGGKGCVRGGDEKIKNVAWKSLVD